MFFIFFCLVLFYFTGFDVLNVPFIHSFSIRFIDVTLAIRSYQSRKHGGFHFLIFLFFFFSLFKGWFCNFIHLILFVLFFNFPFFSNFFLFGLFYNNCTLLVVFWGNLFFLFVCWFNWGFLSYVYVCVFLLFNFSRVRKRVYFLDFLILRGREGEICKWNADLFPIIIDLFFSCCCFCRLPCWLLMSFEMEGQVIGARETSLAMNTFERFGAGVFAIMAR